MKRACRASAGASTDTPVCVSSEYGQMQALRPISDMHKAGAARGEIVNECELLGSSHCTLNIHDETVA